MDRRLGAPRQARRRLEARSAVTTPGEPALFRALYEDAPVAYMPIGTDDIAHMR